MVPGLWQWPGEAAPCKHAVVPLWYSASLQQCTGQGPSEPEVASNTVFQNAECIHTISDWQHQGRLNYKVSYFCDKTLINAGRNSKLWSIDLPPVHIRDARARYRKELPFWSAFMRAFETILRAKILWSEIFPFKRSLLYSDLSVWVFFPSVSINTVVERENTTRKLEYFGIVTARRQQVSCTEF